MLPTYPKVALLHTLMWTALSGGVPAGNTLQGMVNLDTAPVTPNLDMIREDHREALMNAIFPSDIISIPSLEREETSGQY